MALRLIQVCRRCFHPKKIMNHRKQEYTRRLKPKKAKGMHLAGTQALDSSWKSTKKWHPDTLRLKDADTGQVNEEILDWVVFLRMAEKCPRVWQRSRTKLGQSALARLKVEKGNCPKTCGRETDFKMYFDEHVVISQKYIEHIYLSTKKTHTKLDAKTCRNLHRECRAKNDRFCKTQCKCTNQCF